MSEKEEQKDKSQFFIDCVLKIKEKSLDKKLQYYKNQIKDKESKNEDFSALLTEYQNIMKKKLELKEALQKALWEE
jgi:hypothetical protein